MKITPIILKNVFLKTSSATDDGILTFPELSGGLHSTHRQEFENLYRAINIDYFQTYQSATGNSLFGTPRQIRFGIRLEY